MNMVHEVAKYFSETSVDGEVIYDYTNNAFNSAVEVSSAEGNGVTFGNTTVKYVDPGIWGIDIVFVD